MLLIALTGALLYLIGCSFTWALLPTSWKVVETEEVPALAAALWPVTLVLFVCYWVLLIGPHTVAWLRRPKKTSLPRATVRKP